MKPSDLYNRKFLLKGADTLSGQATLSSSFCRPSEKGFTLKDKKYTTPHPLPHHIGISFFWHLFFLLEYIPFHMKLFAQKFKQEVTNVAFLQGLQGTVFRGNLF